MDVRARQVVRISGICGGVPCIEKTRLTCENVVNRLICDKVDIDQYLGDYPHLTRADIMNCLEYCANQMCIVNNTVQYCERCALDRRPPPDPPAAYVKSFEEIRNNPSIVEVGQVYLGSPEEYERNQVREEVWKKARELYNELSEDGGKGR